MGRWGYNQFTLYLFISFLSFILHSCGPLGGALERSSEDEAKKYSEDFSTLDPFGSIGDRPSDSLPDNSSEDQSPIDIYAPIAKGIINATRVQATTVGYADDWILEDLSNEFLDDEEAIVIYGEIDEETAIIASANDGEFLAETTGNRNGSFMLPIHSSEIGYEESIILTGSDDKKERDHAPTMVVHAPDGFLFQEPTYSVQITRNIDAAFENIQITSDGFVVFNGVNSEGEKKIMSVPITGGAPSPLSSMEGEFANIQYAADYSFLIGYSKNTKNLVRINPDGSAETISFHMGGTESFKLNPDGSYVAQEYKQYENGMELSRIMVFPTDPSLGLPYKVVKSPAEHHEFVWQNTNHLLVISEYGPSLHQLEVYDVSNIVFYGKVQIMADPIILFKSNHLIRNLTFFGDMKTQFSFECGDVHPSVNLCLVNLNKGSTRIIDKEFLGLENVEIDIHNHQWNANAKLILFDLTVKQEKKELNPDNYEKESVIAAFDPYKGESFILTKGFQVRIHPTNSQLISYLSYNEYGQIDVSTLNLALHPLTRDLFEE